MAARTHPAVASRNAVLARCGDWLDPDDADVILDAIFAALDDADYVVLPKDTEREAYREGFNDGLASVSEGL